MLMEWALALWAISLQSAPGGGTEAETGFEERLKRATGPAQLRQLESWCSKNRLAEEKKSVHELLTKYGPPAKPAADFAQRESARAVGDIARASVNDFRDRKAKSAGEEVRRILAAMKADGYAPPEAKERLRTLVRGLLVDEAAERAALEEEIKALEPSDRGAEEQKKAAASFESQMKSLLKKFTDQIFSAVEKCMAAGEAGYAFDLYRFLLQADPENERAHRSLGEQKIEGHWLRPYDQEQWHAGLLWDAKAGWVPIKERSRLERGDVYDAAAKQWGSETQLNQKHAEAGTPWVIESEHFQLSSTADHALDVELINRMEAFFLQAFRQYDLFFSAKGQSKGSSLIFGVVKDRKKLVVNFYRDAAQFKRSANPPTAWAAGFYSGGKHASYFHAFDGRLIAEVMQHELTHQILGEYSDGGRGDGPWLAEGAAVFLESAEFVNGTLTLGGLEQNRLIAEYRKKLRAGTAEHPFKVMVEAFGPGQNWDRGDIDRNYRGAGAAVYFLMHFDGGRYRADAIALLKDAYNGTPRPLPEYFGISVEGLDALMVRFYKDCELP